MVRLTLRSLLSVAAVAASLALTACERPPGELPKHSFNAVDITGADYARALTLPDTDGHMRSLSDWKGKVVVLFFGYTQCPDVCPTTMSELAEVKRSLGKDGDRVQGVFVTIDPQRDTPQVLKNYMSSFDPTFVALRGSDEQTKAVARDFRVFYAKVPGKTAGSYTMDHTAGSFIYDTQGRLRLFTRYGSGPKALASDLQALLSDSA
jgi:protein SCO1/2